MRRWTRTIPGKELREIIIRNSQGKTTVRGWNRDDIFIETEISVPGEIVSNHLQPDIRNTKRMLRIECSDWKRTVDFQNVISRRLFRDPDDTFDGDAHPSSGEDPEVDPDAFDLLESLEESREDFLRQERVKITVMIPQSMKLDVRSFNGVIFVEQAGGIARLRNINGPIRVSGKLDELIAISTNGSVSLENGWTNRVKVRTINGAVRMQFGRVSGSAFARSLNGNIRVIVPRETSLSLKAISRFAPVKVASRFHAFQRGYNYYEGTLGGGAHEMVLQSLTGAVTVAFSDSGHTGAELPAHEASQASSEAILSRMVKRGLLTEVEAEKLRARL